MHLRSAIDGKLKDVGMVELAAVSWLSWASRFTRFKAQRWEFQSLEGFLCDRSVHTILKHSHLKSSCFANPQYLRFSAGPKPAIKSHLELHSTALNLDVRVASLGTESLKRFVSNRSGPADAA